MPITSIGVGDMAQVVNVPGVPTHASVYYFAEVRCFQRCDGCGVMGGPISTVYLSYFTRLDSGTAVRTTVLGSHHSDDISCKTIALAAFVKKVVKYDRAQDGVE